MNTVATTPELAALKERLKATWMAGDYDRFSRKHKYLFRWVLCCSTVLHLFRLTRKRSPMSGSA